MVRVVPVPVERITFDGEGADFCLGDFAEVNWERSFCLCIVTRLYRFIPSGSKLEPAKFPIRGVLDVSSLLSWAGHPISDVQEARSSVPSSWVVRMEEVMLRPPCATVHQLDRNPVARIPNIVQKLYELGGEPEAAFRGWPFTLAGIYSSASRA